MAAARRIPKDIGKRYFTVEDPIFHRTIHVLLNFSCEQWSDWQKRHRIRAEPAEDQKMTTNFGGFSTQFDSDEAPTEWAILLNHFNWTIVDQGTLIHEIVHTVMKIFSFNNIPFNHDTQEFIAHMVGNIYEDIAAKLLAKGRK